MKYPYWEYDHTKKEITIYFSEHDYTVYDDEAEELYKEFEYGTEKCRKQLLNELYLDYEHSDPYRRSDDLL